MAYTLRTSFYDEAPIVDAFDTLADALDAWADTADAYAHAPSDVAGDIRGLVLRDPSGAVLRKHGYS